MSEREAKLVVAASFEIPRRESLAKRVVSTKVDTIVQHSVYYDTAALRLTRSGASLRFRSDDGWTVKLPVRRTTSSLVRDEHPFTGGPGTPPASASSLVLALTRKEPLLEVARIDTHRTRTLLVDKRGRLLAELADDTVIGRTTTDTESRFREIEVELADSTPDSFLDEVISNLKAAGARPARATSKVARVLGDEAAAPPDVGDERPLGPKASTGDLVRNALTSSLRQLLAFDPAIRLSDNVEAIHKTRVATRRLRSDLRTFRPLLKPAWSEPIRAELKWLGGLLGHVRDADVLIDALTTKVRQLPDGHRATGEQLIERLRDARSRDRTALLHALDSDRYAHLLDRLVAASASPRPRKRGDLERTAKSTRRLVAAPRKRLLRKVRRLDPEPRDRDLHEVRKRAKQARYACEAVAPVLGRPARRASKRFAKIQQVLGDHQDTVVAATWLLDAARDAGERDEAFVAGELAGLFLTDRRAARAAWPATWKRARRAHL